MTKYHYYSDALNLESEVEYLLKSISKDGECVVNGSSNIFDIEIRQGLTRIDLPINSFVEVKMNLLFDTFERIRRTVAKCKFECDDLQCVLIVYKYSRFSYGLLKEYFADISDKVAVDIRFMSLDELRQKVLTKDDRDVVDDVIKEEVDTSWEERRDYILRMAKDAVHSNRVSLFLGAGVSADAGMVSWDNLLKSLINRRGHSVITKRDMSSIKEVNFNSSLIIGRYVRQADSKLDIPIAIQGILYANLHQSNLIDSICRFINSGVIDSVITYNYDMLVEDKMGVDASYSNVKVAPVYGNNRIAKDCIPIYHVHGIIPNPASGSYLKPDIVLTEDEYHKLYLNSYDWSNIEQLHALDRNVCFFIGLSMSDPNLRRLLDFSHLKQEESKPTHYAFLKRRLFSEVGVQRHNNKNIENWRILESMYSSLGVSVIWYSDYSDLPELIGRLHEADI